VSGNDVQTLVTTLQQAVRTDQSLPFTGTLIGVPSLDGVVAEAFASGLVIDGAVPAASTDGKSAVVSGSVTYGTVPCGAALTLTPDGTTVDLVLTLTPPAPWTLQQAFPGVLDPTLSGATFTSGGLVLCSVAYTEPVQQLVLAPGFWVVAELGLSTTYPLLVPVLAGATTLPIHGPVTDPTLPLLQLTTTPAPAKLGSTTLADLSIELAVTNLSTAASPVTHASASISASVDLGQGVGGTATVQLPSDPTLLRVDVAFENVNLGDLALLAPYLGSANPLASLPKEVADAIQSAGSRFALTALGLRFDLSSFAFTAADIEVTVDLKGFGPMSAVPLIEIDDLDILWSVDLTTSPAEITFAARADLEVKTTPPCGMSLGFQTQPGGDYLIDLRENAGAVLPLSALVTAFLPGLDLPQLNVSGFGLTLAPRDGIYTFDATIDGTWAPMQAIDLELASVAISAVYDSAATPALTGSIASTLTFDVEPGAGAAAAELARSLKDDDGFVAPPRTIDLTMAAVRDTAGWTFSGNTGGGQVVPVGDLVAALEHTFSTDATPPASLATLTIQNLGLSFSTATEAFAFGCQIDFEIEGEPVEIIVSVDIASGAQGLVTNFGGSVLVGDLLFELHFETSSTTTMLVGTYTHKPGDPPSLALRDLVAKLSPAAAAEVPADLEIQLDGVKLVFVQDATTEFAFSLDLSASFGLQDLPVVGSHLPPASVGVEHLQLLYSTATLSATDAAQVNALLPAQVGPLPAAGLSPGPAVTATLTAGGAQQPVAFGVPTTGGATPPSLPQPTAPGMEILAAAPAPAAPTSAPTSHWFDVAKTVGPVSIARIGVQYQDSTLFLLLDATLGLSALTVGLQGAGLGSPLSAFVPKGHLDGLSIAFSDGPVTIDGGFLAVPDPPAGVTDEYLGTLTIAIDPYLITGIGAYAKIDDAPSFFAFAEVDGEFGGPPAFFITGFMGGFGYHWSLTLPPADQVYQFPFVAGVGNPTFFGQQNPTPMQVLGALSGSTGKPAWVTPSADENWIAGGITFTSFELVAGRLLAVAEFGKEFEVALLGLATVVLPQGDAAEAYAYAELQLEVVLKPDDGTFSAIASLTPNSYVLTKSCHLTGGFAFCVWFGDNPHAGDFVLTIGGYHPAFTPPSWYPSVPRLGIDWQVDSDLSIKGGAYFALTPTAAMAGASISVLYASGDLKAWLNAYADVMIRWKPFYLTAQIGISVGVSYTLDLLFTRTTLSVELGAQLELWGPPTGGRVHIDWTIISFTIGFGAGEAGPDDLTIEWPGFAQLLPGGGGSSSAAHAVAADALAADGLAEPAAAPPAPTPTIVTLTVAAGLASTDPSTGDWIVRSDELVLNASSGVPSTAATVAGTAVELPPKAPATIDIRPMGATGITAALDLTITPVDAQATVAWPAPTVQSSSLPEALWGAPLDAHAAPAPTAKLIDDLPTGLAVSAPAATQGSAVGPVDPASIVTPLGTGIQPLLPAKQPDPIAEPVADPGSIAAIATGVASAAAITAQADLVAALAALGAAPPTSAPLTRLGAQAGGVFSQPPMRSA
jgi:hypothetical protein